MLNLLDTMVELTQKFVKQRERENSKRAKQEMGESDEDEDDVDHSDDCDDDDSEEDDDENLEDLDDELAIAPSDVQKSETQMESAESNLGFVSPSETKSRKAKAKAAAILENSDDTSSESDSIAES